MPAWSPDGKLIVYVTLTCPGSVDQLGALWTRFHVSTSSGSASLTKARSRLSISPRQSPAEIEPAYRTRLRFGGARSGCSAWAQTTGHRQAHCCGAQVPSRAPTLRRFPSRRPAARRVRARASPTETVAAWWGDRTRATDRRTAQLVAKRVSVWRRDVLTNQVDPAWLVCRLPTDPGAFGQGWAGKAEGRDEWARKRAPCTVSIYRRPRSRGLLAQVRQGSRSAATSDAKSAGS
jgi:hypothetical protein